MPKHTINWINDHTQISDRLDARVQLMQDYLDGKPDDFDGITVKRSLLGQAREQITWYRQSINALDFVGCVACRRALVLSQVYIDSASEKWYTACQVNKSCKLESVMPAKRYPVLLDPDQREFLMDLISCGRDSARKLTRARILLKADESEGPPAYADKQIQVPRFAER